MSSIKKFLNRAKTIIALRTIQSEVEQKQLLERLHKLGLLKKESRVEDVLNLTLKDVMERRLQTLVCRKSIAKSMMQAREFITHEHIAVAGSKITTPSHLVTIHEENQIKLVDPITVSPPKEQKAAEKKE